MAILGKFPKQPNEILDYDIDFTRWLENTDGDQGLTASVAVAPPGITIDRHVVSGGVVKVWLSGGENGQQYKVTATLVTVNGRRKEGEIMIRVKEV